MKNPFIILLLLLLGALPSVVSAQEERGAPQIVTFRSGDDADLSRGIVLMPDTDGGNPPVILRLLDESGIPYTRGNQSGRGASLEIKRVAAIRHAPENNGNVYSIEVSGGSISVEYTSPLAASDAISYLGELYRGLGRRKRMAGQNIIGWNTNHSSSVFRWTEPGTEIPLYATRVEMMLTDPVKGWIGACDVLHAVDYHESLYEGAMLTYADIEAERQKLLDNGVLEVLPVFDLTTTNRCFEEVTGHPMLSVEGMRFVTLLLDAYFAESGTGAVGFIVPEGRYRDQVREIVGRYPHVDVRFIEE